MAVSGTFQRRSHPVNPLSLDPTVPPAPHLLHYLQYPSLPPALFLPLPIIALPSSRLSLSALVRLKWDTAMSKVDTVRMGLKDEYPPHAHPPFQLPGPEVLIPPNIQE